RTDHETNLPGARPNGHYTQSTGTSSSELARVQSAIFFYWSGHPRALHSFPTRRSSDLFVVLDVADASQVDAALAVRLCDRHRGVDRKSTRLNSSHVAISYAVFCLKKKKTTLNAVRQSDSVPKENLPHRVERATPLLRAL